MDFFFKSVTWAGSILVLLPIALMAAGTLLSRGRQADALLIAGGLMGAFVLAHGLKRLFARPRPNIEDLLVAMPPDFSFPSAHTTQAAANSTTHGNTDARTRPATPKPAPAGIC